MGLVPLAAELGPEGDLPRPVGREPDDDDLVHGAREDLPREADAALHVARPDNGGVQVELVPVVRHGFLGRELEDQPAEGLVFHLLDRVAHEIPAEQDVGHLVVPVEDELLDLRQGLEAALDHRGIGAARPEGILVELDLLFVGLAEDHGPEPAVADRKGVLPLVGRVGVPEPRRGIGPGLACSWARAPVAKIKTAARAAGRRQSRADGARIFIRVSSSGRAGWPLHSIARGRRRGAVPSGPDARSGPGLNGFGRG